MKQKMAQFAFSSSQEDKRDVGLEMPDGKGAVPSNGQPESPAQGAHCNENSNSPDPACPSAGGLKPFLALFGADRVLDNIPPEDPRIPADPSFAQEASFAAKNSGLVGILCGQLAHKHLVALVCPDSTAVKTFIRTNPNLQFPTICYASGAHVGFLFVEGPVPPNLRTKTLTWLADGVVPVGADLADTAGTGLEIPRIRFEAIVWEPAVREAFEVDEIQRQYGSPIIPVRKREYILDPRFLAERMLNQYHLAYDRGEESFVC